MEPDLSDDDWADDVRGLAFKLQAPVDVAYNDGAGHEHDRRSDTAKDQTEKSETRAVGSHDTPLKSFLPG